MTSSHADPEGSFDAAARDAAAALLLGAEDVVWVLLDEAGAIEAANAGFERLLGTPQATLWEHVVGSDAALAALRTWLAEAGEERLINLRGAAGPATLSLRARVVRAGDGRLLLRGAEEVDETRAYAAELARVTNELAVLARENRRRTRELEAALRERDQAFWYVRRVQEVLPICMRCGDVKGADHEYGDGDDVGEADWQPLAEFLRANASFLSHGYCPTCADATLRELGLDPKGAR